MSNKTYRPWDPRKTYLFPPNMTDWLGDDHLAFTVLDLVHELDLSGIEDVLQAADARGEKPYHPRMMVALLIYSYCTGRFSSRGIAQATWDDVATRIVAGDEHPHFTSVNRFRLAHREVFQELFVQVLRICQQAGLVSLGHVALDGTKINANASKHKAMSYDRMKATEKRLQAEVSELLGRADEVDRSEDALHGADRSGTEVSEELRRRETRLKRIREAKAELEAEAAAARKLELEAQAAQAREAAAAAADPAAARRHGRRADARERSAATIDASPDTLPGASEGLPFHAPAHERDGTPKPKAQRNFTDGDSRIMTSGGGFVQAYNSQVAVDETCGIIVAQLVTNQPPDVEHLQPVAEQVRQHLNAYPNTMTADAGFWSADNASYCEQTGIDAFISTRRRRHEEPLGPQAAVPPPNDQQPRTRMEAKVTSDEGAKIYAKRKWVVEPVFGQIKEVRGFRRFSLRGLGKVSDEWALICLTHNVLKFHRNR